MFRPWREAPYDGAKPEEEIYTVGLKVASENSDNLGLVQIRNQVFPKVGVAGGIFERQL